MKFLNVEKTLACFNKCQLRLRENNGFVLIGKKTSKNNNNE